MAQKYVLAIFNADYADEFDVSGFELVTEKYWTEFETKCKSVTKKFDIYFGTNECLTFKNGQQLLSQINVTIITREEYITISRLIGDSFGFGIIDSAESLFEEDEDEE